MNQPLHKYAEARFEGRRLYELRDNGVFVSGNVIMSNSFETLILYRQLLPNVSVLRRRNPIFWYGLISFPIFCLIYYALVFHVILPWDSFFPGASAGMALLSIIFMIATYKNVEYARFCSESGVGILDIAKSGPDVANFDAFVAQIQDEIERSNKTAE